ncbi:hypothetical protein INT44_000879 [Umbelopsis vinacea]|uniref:Protein kinase domain-containing protein n=1 Tax=Umbelopsis vinacea TaxID=44442 RepID=A0A8H7QAF7_9FUNG|nr:hypothetical protein INT44_000879 [Umbelopsis vinacea]
MPVLDTLKNFIRQGKNAVSAQQGTLPKDQVAHDNEKRSFNNTEAAVRIVEEEKLAKADKRLPSYPKLERYTLISEMGDGAFSKVYKAYDTQTGDYVAVKVVTKPDKNAAESQRHLHPKMKKRPKATERANILKEVQIMRSIHHDNVIRLISFSESDDYYYLVLELCDGGELFHQIVKLTFFSEDLARHVITQLAHALRHLHEECGVVHRDIKPENILFNPIPIVPSKNPKSLPLSHPDDAPKLDEGEFTPGVGGGGIGIVKLADFGLSKVIWDASTMTPCGTVGYTAPEIIRDQKYSKAVDMWAMGCVLYTLLCGFPPFYDESIKTLTEKVARGEYSFLSPWWDDISSSSKDLITHLLCIDPDERYTIDEFLQHPWIQKGQDNLPKEPQPIPVVVDTPLTANPESRKDLLSPGVSMKEVFDVTYAVQRMGEEKKRRKALYERMGNLKMADETTEGGTQAFQDSIDSGDDSSSTLEDSDDEFGRVLLPADVPAALAGKMGGDDLTRRLQAAQQRRIARKVAEQKQRQATLVASPDTQSTVSSTSSKRSRRAPFDLNMNNATLLMKRNIEPPKA